MAVSEPRRYEGRLLRQAFGILALLYVGLMLHRARADQSAWVAADILALLGYGACAWLLHRVLESMRIRGDEGIVPIVVLLTGLGLLLKLRLADPPLTADGLARLVVYPLATASLAAAVWVSRERLHWLEKASWLSGVLGAGGMVWLVERGVNFRGAMYGPGLTTPSEVLKLLMVIFLAGFLKRRRSLPEHLAFGFVWLVVQVLLVKQSDLGMVVILGGLLLSLFYVATGRTRLLLLGLALAGAAGVLVYYLGPLSAATGRGQERIAIWLNPWSSPQGSGYQTIQALFAMRAGGWEGLGLGGGYPRLTPLVESDFIYAAVAEELGLLGAGLVLLLYLTLFRRGYRIAMLATDPFRSRVAIGCATVLALQTWLNIAGVVRLVPITGITLPYISHAGSSLLVSHALIGLILAVGHDVEMVDAPGRDRARAARDERRDGGDGGAAGHPAG